MKLTKEDAQEFMHKLAILEQTTDLQEDYNITQSQATEIFNLIPINGGEFGFPAWAFPAIQGEMLDHCEVLKDIAQDAKNANDKKEFQRISKLARHIENLIK